MSEIPYRFETPVPKYFREAGWFSNLKCLAFVTWAFSRCYTFEREVYHDGKKILLKPYQFIFGRRICSEQTGLTEMEVRIQVNCLISAGFVKNATNRITKRYSIYEWVTECFSETDNQVNIQQTTNRQPTDNHNTDYKTKDIRTTTTTPPPSSEAVVVVVSKEKNTKLLENASACKKWLDQEAVKTRKRKIGHDYEEITWGKDWILPQKMYEKYISQYGYKYFIEQMNYMVAQQNQFDKGKSKNPIKNPETYLRMACNENYASATED